jgi:iron(II)-dependent oxidoreductase
VDVDGMLPIPAGDVIMGCDDSGGTFCDGDEQPVHTVGVSAFRMHAFEVTRAEFVDFLNEHGNDCDGERCIGVFVNPEITESGGTWSVQAGVENTPAMEVLWFGADTYCRTYGWRLATEAEWERAARGDDGRIWRSWGAARSSAGEAGAATRRPSSPG